MVKSRVKPTVLIMMLSKWPYMLCLSKSVLSLSFLAHAGQSESLTSA